jgi:ubiquitin thioesterase OTU1
MRARYKGPAGTGTIEIEDTASIQDLFDELRAKTGIQEFAVKYGPPMDMKTLESGSKAMTAKELGLHGETLTIVPQETRSLTPFGTTPLKDEAKMEELHPHLEPSTQSGKEPDDIVIPWAEREGTLCM